MLDPQLKRGMLDACVLAVLCRGESYGYKIIKDLSEKLTVSESTLYPILRRLENAEMLSEHSVEHKGRLRKIYSITTRGEAHLDDFLASREEVISLYDFAGRLRNDED